MKVAILVDCSSGRSDFLDILSQVENLGRPTPAFFPGKVGEQGAARWQGGGS